MRRLPTIAGEFTDEWLFAGAEEEVKLDVCTKLIAYVNSLKPFTGQHYSGLMQKKKQLPKFESVQSVFLPLCGFDATTPSFLFPNAKEFLGFAHEEFLPRKNIDINFQLIYYEMQRLTGNTLGNLAWPDMFSSKYIGPELLMHLRVNCGAIIDKITSRKLHDNNLLYKITYTIKGVEHIFSYIQYEIPYQRPLDVDSFTRSFIILHKPDASLIKGAKRRAFEHDLPVCLAGLFYPEQIIFTDNFDQGISLPTVIMDTDHSSTGLWKKEEKASWKFGATFSGPGSATLDISGRKKEYLRVLIDLYKKWILRSLENADTDDTSKKITELATYLGSQDQLNEKASKESHGKDEEDDNTDTNGHENLFFAGFKEIYKLLILFPNTSEEHEELYRWINSVLNPVKEIPGEVLEENENIRVTLHETTVEPGKKYKFTFTHTYIGDRKISLDDAIRIFTSAFFPDQRYKPNQKMFRIIFDFIGLQPENPYPEENGFYELIKNISQACALDMLQKNIFYDKVTITIVIHKTEEHVYVKIKDDGPGYKHQKKGESFKSITKRDTQEKKQNRLESNAIAYATQQIPKPDLFKNGKKRGLTLIYKYPLSAWCYQGPDPETETPAPPSGGAAADAAAIPVALQAPSSLLLFDYGGPATPRAAAPCPTTSDRSALLGTQSTSRMGVFCCPYETSHSDQGGNNSSEQGNDCCII